MIRHCTLFLHTQCKLFDQDCSEVCSSLSQPAATHHLSCAGGGCGATQAAAAAAPLRLLLLWRHSGSGRFLVLFRCPLVRRSHKFGITVLVHLEAAFPCNEQGKVSKRVEKLQCSKIDGCSYLRRGIPIHMKESCRHCESVTSDWTWHSKESLASELLLLVYQQNRQSYRESLGRPPLIGGATKGWQISRGAAPRARQRPVQDTTLVAGF
jgi:hypothetical protein